MTFEELIKLDIGTRMIRATSQTEIHRVRSHIPPIYQTVNFEYENVQDGLSVFLGEKPGYFYTRDGNPTSDLFAQLVALLENAEAGLAVASGMAAISSAILSIVKPGDNIISSKNIYGGTKNWFSSQLSSLNVTTHFVDITNMDEIQQACTEKTKILYTEVLGSPNLVIADINKLAEFARKTQLILIVDSTFTPPPIIQPLTLGADIVIHSTTKYINGHGDAIGGAIVCSAETIAAISKVVKLYGGVISPFNAWLSIRGLKTLALRLEKHCSNAQRIADFLKEHPKVAKIHYPGLPGHPQHDLAQTQLNGFGGMLAFEVHGGFDAGVKVMNAVRLCSFTTSLGEIDTLIIHPASTSHISLSKKEREQAGVPDGLIRLSVGVEAAEDLIHDLEQALDKI
ncbi:aminotransferase class I/II-fold pyridoxal phosphate-dependent enzyme [candidate division KSB1 bacterium]|nr:aminotransferase class I/II-fold pyridoxal phosphate-dependent enzyme [candidate division KSB1 bacterium]RQW05145.1 MAG: aminotransferase class I/II-fold pyridoxal phosphate-dependent enzyme [candidate division KSB1 bacterium]